MLLAVEAKGVKGATLSSSSSSGSYLSGDRGGQEGGGVRPEVGHREGASLAEGKAITW